MEASSSIKHLQAPQVPSHGLDDEMFHPQSELRSTTTYCSWKFSDSLFTLLRGSVGACMMFRMRRCQGG